MAACEFADRYHLRDRLNKSQQLLWYQMVMQNDIGLADQLITLLRYQLDIAGTCTNAIDFSLGHLAFF
jgi:hypothetical protein